MCWVPPHPLLQSLNTLPKHKMIDVLRSVTRQDSHYFSCHKIPRLLLCPLCREVGKYNQDYFIPLVPLSPHPLKRRKCFCSINCLEGILFSWNEVRPPQFHRWSSGMVMLAACEGQECIGKLSSMFSQEWMESELYRAKMLPGSLFICLLLVVSLVDYILFACLLACFSSCNSGWPQNCKLNSQGPELHGSATTHSSRLDFDEMPTGRAWSPGYWKRAVTHLEQCSRTFLSVFFFQKSLK